MPEQNAAGHEPVMPSIEPGALMAAHIEFANSTAHTIRDRFEDALFVYLYAVENAEEFGPEVQYPSPAEIREALDQRHHCKERGLV